MYLLISGNINGRNCISKIKYQTTKVSTYYNICFHFCFSTMAYSWDNRVKFVVRYMYDIDNNGFLDKNDFECLAVRNTVIEGKGNWDEATFKKNQEIMANLWNEIADLADFNKVCDVVTFF